MMQNALISLNRHELLTVEALFERLFPADEHGPGAAEIGALNYLELALAGAYSSKVELYRLGLAALDRGRLLSSVQHSSLAILRTGMR